MSDSFEVEVGVLPPPRIVPETRRRDDYLSSLCIKRFKQVIMIMFVLSSILSCVGFFICMVTRREIFILPPHMSSPLPPPPHSTPPSIVSTPRVSSPSPPSPPSLPIVSPGAPPGSGHVDALFLAPPPLEPPPSKPPGCRDGSLTDLDAVSFEDFQVIEVNRVSSKRCLGFEEGFVEAISGDPQAHGSFYADIFPPAVNASTRINYGCWFVHSPGSGIRINLRKTLRGGNVADMQRLLGLPSHFSDGNPYQSDRLFCQRAVALGYESIYWHSHGWIEVVVCYGGCATQRVKGACPPIPLYTDEFDECLCDDHAFNLNCGCDDLYLDGIPDVGACAGGDCGNEIWKNFLRSGIDARC